jgi:hypothetical protein
VGEALWEVAELLPRQRVDLLSEQPEIVRSVAQIVEYRQSFVVSPEPDQGINHPERTGQKGSFLRATLGGQVPIEKRPACVEVPANSGNRPFEPR